MAIRRTSGFGGDKMGGVRKQLRLHSGRKMRVNEHEGQLCNHGRRVLAAIMVIGPA